MFHICIFHLCIFVLFFSLNPDRWQVCLPQVFTVALSVDSSRWEWQGKQKHFRDRGDINNQDWAVPWSLRTILQMLKRPPAGRQLIAKTVGDPTVTFCSVPKALKRFIFHCSRAGGEKKKKKSGEDKEEQTGNCFLWCFSSQRNNEDMKSKIQLCMVSIQQLWHNKLSRESRNKKLWREQ